MKGLPAPARSRLAQMRFRVSFKAKPASPQRSRSFSFPLEAGYGPFFAISHLQPVSSFLPRSTGGRAMRPTMESESSSSRKGPNTKGCRASRATAVRSTISTLNITATLSNPAPPFAHPAPFREDRRDYLNYLKQFLICQCFLHFDPSGRCGCGSIRSWWVRLWTQICGKSRRKSKTAHIQLPHLKGSTKHR